MSYAIRFGIERLTSEINTGSKVSIAPSLAVDDEFEVKEDATKTQIKAAFMKSLKAKKLNKKVLSEFVELVA